jgi:acyl-CoA reductase-like NAD-dependent aldehyde dehydrogenase
MSSSSSCIVDNPYTGKVEVDLPYMSAADAMKSVDAAHAVQQRVWRHTPLAERLALCERVVAELKKSGDGDSLRERFARDTSRQMGKPLHYARGEVDGMIERAEQMIALAPAALAAVPLPDKPNFARRIEKLGVGVCAIVSPWNYPGLTAVNAVIPSVLAGNAVLLKHSSRTPLCGEHFVEAFERAGAPRGLVQALHADHGTVASVLGRAEVGYAHFTGSVRGGHELYATVAKSRFIDIGLELGGKDPAYVAADAHDVENAAEQLIDGAMCNAGKSCCGI